MNIKKINVEPLISYSQSNTEYILKGFDKHGIFRKEKIILKGTEPVISKYFEFGDDIIFERVESITPKVLL